MIATGSASSAGVSRGSCEGGSSCSASTCATARGVGKSKVSVTGSGSPVSSRSRFRSRTARMESSPSPRKSVSGEKEEEGAGVAPFASTWPTQSRTSSSASSTVYGAAEPRRAVTGTDSRPASRCRSARRSSFPAGESGSSRTVTSSRGILWSASPRRRRNAVTSLRPIVRSAWSVTTRHGYSPSRSSGAPATASGPRPVRPASSPSTSVAANFRPPVLISSVARPCSTTTPSGPTAARSPVRSQPSSVRAERVSSGSRKYPRNSPGPRYWSSPVLPAALTPSSSTTRTSAPLTGLPTLSSGSPARVRVPVPISDIPHTTTTSQSRAARTCAVRAGAMAAPAVRTWWGAKPAGSSVLASRSMTSRSWAGTAKMTRGSCCRASSRKRSGSQPVSRTCPRAANSAACRLCRPNRWLMGQAVRTMPSKASAASAVTAAVFDSRPSWLCRHSLGRAEVVPDEGIRTSGMPGVTSTGRGPLPAQAASSPSSDPAPGSSRSVSDAPASSTRRRDGTLWSSERAIAGSPSGCSARTRRTGSARASSAWTSPYVVPWWTGSRTAPTAATARCRVANSQEFGSRAATTSPGSTPDSCSPRASASTSARHLAQVHERSPSTRATASGADVTAAANTSGSVKPPSTSAAPAGSSSR